MVRPNRENPDAGAYPKYGEDNGPPGGVLPPGVPDALVPSNRSVKANRPGTAAVPHTKHGHGATGHSKQDLERWNDHLPYRY